MTPEELKELNAELEGMDQLKRILLLGLLPGLILPILVYIYKNEEFVISIICFIVITIYFGYTSYWIPLSNLKKDITLQTSDSNSTIVSKIIGSDKDITVRTKSKFKLNYFDLDRLNVSVDQLSTNTKIQIKYARHSKYIFSFKIE